MSLLKRLFGGEREAPETVFWNWFTANSDRYRNFKFGDPAQDLGGNRLAVIDELNDRDQFSGYDLVHVEPAEAYAANLLVVNDRVLIASGFPVFQRQLQDLAYETVVLEMSEFQKMDGGLSCLSLRF